MDLALQAMGLEPVAVLLHVQRIGGYEGRLDSDLAAAGGDGCDVGGGETSRAADEADRVLLGVRV